MDLSVIIVSYNVKPFLEQALHSIVRALEGMDSEIIVVDNGSSDGSPVLLRERFPGIRLIENDENLGFSRANNQALRCAKGKVICLINPDTLVQEDTFRVCMDYLASHTGVGAVGCKILNADGTLQLSCRRSFPTPWIAFTKIMGLARLFPRSRLFGRYHLTYLDPDTTAEVEALSGSFMMVRKQVVDDVGLLDEIFFLYGEDLDWCYRIRLKGWKIVYLPKTQIIHYKGRSTQEAPFDYLPVFYGAMRLFVKKHFHSGWSFLPQWFLVWGIWIRGALSFLSRLGRKLIVPILDAGFLQVGLILALLLRFGHLNHWASYRLVNAVYTTVWMGCLYAVGLYGKGIYSSSKAAGGVMLGLVLNTSITFFFPQYAFSRQVVLTAGVLDAVSLSLWRLMVRFASRIQRIPFLGTVGKTLLRRRALIVGIDSASRQVFHRMRERVDTDYEAVGFLGLDDADLLSSGNGKLPVLGTLKDLGRVARAHRVQEVIFSSETVEYERILNIVAESKDYHVDFKMIPRDVDVVLGRTSMDMLVDLPLVALDYRIFSAPSVFVKRSMDLLGALCLFPLVLPLSFFLWAHPSVRRKKVWISDGREGKISVTELWKNGEKISGGLKCVPLLIEIIKGKMSFVGSEVTAYDGTSPGWGFKPGLTGLIQVNERMRLAPDEKKKYNLYYMKNYSPLLDFEILLKAIFRL